MSNHNYSISEENFFKLQEACSGLYAYIFALDQMSNGDIVKEASVNLLFLLHNQMEAVIKQMECGFPSKIDRDALLYMQKHGVTYPEAVNTVNSQ